MLSVLIPTYNYDVSKLVQNVHTQLEASKIAYEIIVFEDGSQDFTNKDFNLAHTRVIKNELNIGRVNARQFLANNAQYDWLMFLDADVLPKDDFFISHYIKAITLDFEAIFGGFKYYDSKPETNKLLRWKYGKTKEQVPAKTRNKTPYKVIISANFCIKKTTFSNIHFDTNNTGYGYDNFFGALLKQQQVKVLHINNEVFHLGVETSEKYLYKKEQAAINLLELYNTNVASKHDNDLLHLYSKVKRNKLTRLFSVFYTVFKNIMKRNLTGSNPSIKLLQVYRICYMCYKSRGN